MKNWKSFLMAAAFLLAGTVAQAATLSLTLASPFQYAPPVLPSGAVVAFNATVTNLTGQTVYLNGDSFSIAAPLFLDDSPYFNNYPLSLAPLASYTGELFAVDVPSTTAIGLYPGSFAITGGFGAFDDNVLASANFNVDVSPEPSSLLLLGTGMAGGVLALGGDLRRRLIG